MMYDLLIGIDPGVSTGVAVWDGKALIYCKTHNIAEAAFAVKSYADSHNIKL